MAVERKEPKSGPATVEKVVPLGRSVRLAEAFDPTVAQLTRRDVERADGLAKRSGGIVRQLWFSRLFSTR